VRKKVIEGNADANEPLRAGFGDAGVLVVM